MCQLNRSAVRTLALKAEELNSLKDIIEKRKNPGELTAGPLELCAQHSRAGDGTLCQKEQREN
ncbi:hypothetical protein F7725_015683 [Dissostichus mawsoni]|uniref:Uncharacterized protein n=1 Tax=Dissostichus mawsoni TaxID=36200 RepID=A0A7J5YI63_DISMA|nr:hypothetical protein F7725_015683 [Dissostichus mawsoni]